jgi:N-acetylmuramic acid 6-phosphate etherase
VQAGNLKLQKRARGIVSSIAGVDEKAARAALETAEGDVKLAVLLCSGIETIGGARQRLKEAGENLRVALSAKAAL